MAKVLGCVCFLTIFLIIIYNCNNHCAANEINEHAFYDVSASYLPQIEANKPILAAADTIETHDRQLRRQRRDAPPPATPTDAKNQYQSVSQNGSIALSGAATVANGGGAGGGDAVATLNVATSTNGGAAAANGGGNVMIDYNVHNVGVNGTGQRRTDATIQMAAAAAAAGTQTPGGGDDVKKPNGQQFPKKVGASVQQQQQQQQAAAAAPITTAKTLTPAAAAAAAAANATQQQQQQQLQPNISKQEVDDSIIDDIDISEEKAELEAKQHNFTFKEDYHAYYNSRTTVNKKEAARIWKEVKEIPYNAMLSQSHRRAMTVELKFDFPFYGHNVRSITIATGGFIYTGEYVHSWLAATQYIAPLMANFDTSISNDSFVRMQDNGTAFTVVWENVVLQDKPNYGKFTFSATLFNTGNVVFTYHSVPIMIDSIQDNQHPVKVGLSDAYIIDKYYYFARRKTIYEYHRVTFQQNEIQNGTIIYLNALPTCLSYTECTECINHNTSFECVWCPQLNRCSTGTDRKKQEWIQKGCENSPINKALQCPAPGERGNNAATNQTGSNAAADTIPLPGGGAGSTTVAPAAATSTTSSSSSSNNNNNSNDEITIEKSEAGKALDAEHAAAAAAAADPHKSVGVAFGFMVPICLVFAVTLWLFYAYRNPHTRSGQLLIQFRPSQWSWRRGEARYTAATIHM